MRTASEQSSTINKRKTVRLVFWAGLILGLGLNVPFFLWDLGRYASAAQVYHQVQLGMSRADVSALFAKNDVLCGSYQVGESVRSECWFRDFWREYRIVFEPNTGRVMRKHFFFKRRTALSIARLLTSNQAR